RAQASASRASWKVRLAAVRTPAAAITSLQKALLPSRRAAAALGPKTEMEAARHASATPRAGGGSGPPVTRAASSALARATTAAGSAGATGRFSATPAVPGLPGAQTSRSTRGLSDSFQARACSRPPLPSTSTRIVWLSTLGREEIQRPPGRGVLRIEGDDTLESLAGGGNGSGSGLDLRQPDLGRQQGGQQGVGFPERLAGTVQISVRQQRRAEGELGKAARPSLRHRFPRRAQRAGGIPPRPEEDRLPAQHQ